MNAVQPATPSLREVLASRDGKYVRKATHSLLTSCLPFFRDNSYTWIHLERMLTILNSAPEDPKVDTLPLMFYFLFRQLELLRLRGHKVESLMDDCALFYGEYRRASPSDKLRLLACSATGLQAAA